MKSRTALILAVIATLVTSCILAVTLVQEECGQFEDQVFILHTNDSHGHYKGNVSLDNIAGYRDYLESEGATVFLLDAGDTFQGSSATMLTHGESSMNLMMAMGYDAMVPGNHEFDYTLQTYLSYVDKIGSKVLCSNLYWKDSGELVFDAYTILESNGVRLGVFGLLTTDTYNTAASDILEDVVISDPVAAAEKSVADLKTLGCDYIVALGHVGIGSSYPVTSDGICTQVGGIDVFIDGHSHSSMSHGVPEDQTISFTKSDTVIASTGGDLSSLGVISLGKDIDASLIKSLDYSNNAVKGVIEEQDAELSAILDKHLCTTEIDLNADRTPTRLGESNFADYVCDIVLDRTGADIVLINGGSFRGSVEKGDVKVGDIYNIIPYEDFVQTKILTGSTILQALENSVYGLPDAKGQYLQVSGMTLVYDSSKSPGSRVVSVTIGSKELVLDRSYAVASVDYVMNGKDGYTMMASVNESTSYGVLNDLVIQYLSSKGTINSGDILMGRLIDVNANQ